MLVVFSSFKIFLTVYILEKHKSNPKRIDSVKQMTGQKNDSAIINAVIVDTSGYFNYFKNR